MSRRRRHLADDDDVPRLPRGKGITVTGPQLLKIVMTAALLITMIVLQKPCADATGKFVAGFDNPDAAPAITKPEQIDVEVPGSSGVYVDLTGKDGQEAIEAIEKARAEAAALAGGGAGSGSGSGSGSGTGSGTGTGSGKGSRSGSGSGSGSGSSSGSGSAR